METPQPLVLEPGQGEGFDWMNDLMMVKLTSAATAGLCTLIEDNIKPGFDLHLHLHRTHTEIFYILEGEIAFTVGDEQIMARPGTMIYVPPNTPHAARSEQAAKMLMFYTPGGFEGVLRAYPRMTPEQFADAALMQSLADEYDIMNLAG